MAVDLNGHLDYVCTAKSAAQLRMFVDELLEVGTCFAVIGGELEVRTTRRGVNALRELTGES